MQVLFSRRRDDAIAKITAEPPPSPAQRRGANASLPAKVSRRSSLPDTWLEARHFRVRF
jgi:hypothetical protein